MRLLLLYANPHQVLPVSPYGLEILRASVVDLGLPVEITLCNPFLESLDAPGLLADVLDRVRPDLVAMTVRNMDNAVVACDPEPGPDGRWIDVVDYLAPIAGLTEVLRAWNPALPVVAGGAAFTSCPVEVMDRLGLDFGLAGPGESGFATLVARVAATVGAGGGPAGVRRRIAETLADLPGGLVRTAAGVLSFEKRPEPGVLSRPSLTLPSIAPEYVLFAKARAIPTALRSHSGCPLRCSYCIDPLNARRVDERPASAVAAEATRYVERYGLTHFHLAAPEVNLPYERALIEVCDTLAGSRHGDAITWHGYFNVKPFSERLMDALIRSRCVRPSFSVDAFDDRMLRGHHKNYRLRDLDDTFGLLLRRKPAWMEAQVGVLFGQPGESAATLENAIQRIRRLAEQGVSVAYSCGLRVYPHTPLARTPLDPRHLYRAAGPLAPASAAPRVLTPAELLTPLVYCEPMPPRELAAYLSERLADCPNVGFIDEGPVKEARQPAWLRPLNVATVHLAHGRAGAAAEMLRLVLRSGDGLGVRMAQRLLQQVATPAVPAAPAARPSEPAHPPVPAPAEALTA
ncbi:B12-binding domain-containing radical SAM protein [Streptomyces sp. NBC_01190]|uniref:B12-binding domain-containing radical SAM protein n=1 Tax=Streptomyces sp. NBC_01190 TaxID=2903767 RepID=UPI0038630E05|nr:radical SAM protein [Streptomyces sp. NBC_01190]